MSRQMKGGASSSEFEVDSRDNYLQSKVKTLRLIDGARVALTALALLMGISILGMCLDELFRSCEILVLLTIGLKVFPPMRSTCITTQASLMTIFFLSGLMSLTFAQLLLLWSALQLFSCQTLPRFSQARFNL